MLVNSLPVSRSELVRVRVDWPRVRVLDARAAAASSAAVPFQLVPVFEPAVDGKHPRVSTRLFDVRFEHFIEFSPVNHCTRKPVHTELVMMLQIPPITSIWILIKWMDTFSERVFRFFSQVVFEAQMPPLGIVRYIIQPLKDYDPTSEFEFPSTIELYNERSDSKPWRLFSSKVTNENFKINVHTIGSFENITLENEFYKLTLSSKTGQLEVCYYSFLINPLIIKEVCCTLCTIYTTVSTVPDVRVYSYL